jgi:hypothetical protein
MHKLLDPSSLTVVPLRRPAVWNRSLGAPLEQAYLSQMVFLLAPVIVALMAKALCK